MSEHIKTGVVIPARLALSKLPDEEWVSLSWLQEQIKNQKKIFESDDKCFCPECGAVIGCYAHFCAKCNNRVAVPSEFNPDFTYGTACDWFLSFLEQEEKK